MKLRKWLRTAVLCMLCGLLLGVVLTGCARPQANATQTNTQPQQAASGKTAAPESANASAPNANTQVIQSSLNRGRYPEITVKVGEPVEWHLNAKAGDINGCNRRLVIPAFGVEKTLKAGDNIITFTPTEEGDIAYSCWMGMITSVIHVTANENAGTSANTAAQPSAETPDEADIPDDEDVPPSCCG